MPNRFHENQLAYSVDQFAEAVGISRNSAYKALNSGEVPYCRIGRRIIIPKQALHDFFGGLAAGPNQQKDRA